MNPTPEHLVAVTQGATSTQIAILVLLGAIAVIGIVWLCKWLVDLKMGTLPADISRISESLSALRTEMATIQGKLWSKDDVRVEIKAAIADHMAQCHFHNNTCDLSNH